MYDSTLDKLQSLKPEAQLRAYWLVRSCREAGIPLMIISGYRSADLNSRVGGARNSLHLQGRAFDVQVSGYTRDQIPAAWWSALGAWAETNLGLRWGGRFANPDVNHFDF